jgi:hypothetical protein
MDVRGTQRAGKMMTAVSYYLPLDRITKAIAHVQRGEQVPRGTLQVCFTSFCHCNTLRPRSSTSRSPSSLALDSHRIDSHLRAACVLMTFVWPLQLPLPFMHHAGMPVVQDVVPNGPAHNVLAQGDIVGQ